MRSGYYWVTVLQLEVLQVAFFDGERFHAPGSHSGVWPAFVTVHSPALEAPVVPGAEGAPIRSGMGRFIV